MGAALLRVLGAAAAKLGIGRVAAKGTAVVVADAAEQAAAQGASKATKGLFGRIADLWRGAPKGVKTTAKVGGGAYAVKEGVEAAVGSSPVGEAVKKSGSVLPWILGIAAVGGLLVAFWDKIFGSDEPKAAPQPVMSPSAPAQTAALSPEDQLLAPQMSAPMLLNASRVTASYPAGVGDVGQQMAMQEAPVAANWQMRVGGPKAPQGSFVAAEQARTDAPLAAQNTVA